VLLELQTQAAAVQAVGLLRQLLLEAQEVLDLSLSDI
jgi:hypothetical protein